MRWASPPTERRALLAQCEITQPDLLKKFQSTMNVRLRGKKLHGFVHAHRQHVTDALFFPPHFERLGVNRLPAT